jgi:hypothetical protein
MSDLTLVEEPKITTNGGNLLLYSPGKPDLCESLDTGLHLSSPPLNECITTIVESNEENAILEEVQRDTQHNQETPHRQIEDQEELDSAEIRKITNSNKINSENQRQRVQPAPLRQIEAREGSHLAEPSKASKRRRSKTTSTNTSKNKGATREASAVLEEDQRDAKHDKVAPLQKIEAREGAGSTRKRKIPKHRRSKNAPSKASKNRSTGDDGKDHKSTRPGCENRRIKDQVDITSLSSSDVDLQRSTVEAPSLLPDARHLGKPKSDLATSSSAVQSNIDSRPLVICESSLSNQIQHVVDVNRMDDDSRSLREVEKSPLQLADGNAAIQSTSMTDENGGTQPMSAAPKLKGSQERSGYRGYVFLGMFR